MHSKKKKHGSGKGSAEVPVQLPTFKEIWKDVQTFVSQQTPFKDKKESMADKIAQLGGRKPKGEKRTLATHLHMTKKKREREKRQLQENLKYGLSGGNTWEASHSFMTTKNSGSKRKPEERALKCSEGRFKGGVLDVKHLFKPTPSSGKGRDGAPSTPHSRKGKKRKGGGKRKGKGRR